MPTTLRPLGLRPAGRRPVSAEDRPTRLSRRRLATLLFLAAALLLAAGCSSGRSGEAADSDTVDDVETGDAEVAVPDRAEIIDAADEDGDGVVARDDFEEALAAQQAEAEQERLEAAYAELFGQPDAVVAEGTGFAITVNAVRDSLIEFKPALLDDPENPSREWFVARLDNMIDLQLTASALTDLGFPIDMTVSDGEINQQFVEVFGAGEFDAFALERLIGEDPAITKASSPHCVSLILVATEDEAATARARVVAGETFDDVAAEVNLVPVSQDGTATFGCDLPTAWLQSYGYLAEPFVVLDEGELSEPYQVDYAPAESGFAWMVARVDEVQLENADYGDPSQYGQELLRIQISTYEVAVDERIGYWDMVTRNLVEEAPADTSDAGA